jgi:UDP:flavonoid glycosyltransferase YjiC (YdhE family)
MPQDEKFSALRRIAAEEHRRQGEQLAGHLVQQGHDHRDMLPADGPSPLPAFGMGLPPDPTPEGRERNRVAYAYVHQEAFARAHCQYVDTLRRLGARTEGLPFFMDTPVAAADLYLQLSAEELSYPRSDLPSHVRFVGPLPALGNCAELPLPDWWPDVERADKVVVVTQGTVANHDLGQLIEPTLEALAGAPMLVVAATGGRKMPARLPANARVAPFLSFDTLLPHADVLVTNGGFSTAQLALRLGKPMVTAGTSEDKLEGNAQLAATGSAIDLATDRPSPQALRRAVETVLAEPSYRRNARSLAAHYAQTDALGAIANAIEEAAVSA